MKYKGFIIEPHYCAGSDFTINKQGEVKARKPTAKDIEYYNILDPMEGMKKHCAEFTIKECKETIDNLLLVLNMNSNSPSDWAKLS